MVQAREEIVGMINPFGGLSILFHTIIILIHQKKKGLISILIIAAISIITSVNAQDSIKSLFAQDSNINYLARVSRECRSIQQKDNKRKIVLRLDDVQAGAWSDVSMAMMNDAFKRSMPMLLGVIPIDLEENRSLYSFLQNNLCNLEIAQHGWNHEIETGGVIPEFGNLDKNEALEKILLGKEKLEKLISKQITTFIPPNNVYSYGAEQAFKQAGFKIVSSEGNGYFDYSVSTYDFDKHKLNPISYVIENCKKNLALKNICTIMIHPQDYATEGKLDTVKYDKYLRLLDNLAELDASFVTMKGLVNPSEHVLSLPKNMFSGWYNPKTADNIEISFSNASKKINIISPVWYRVESDGSFGELGQIDKKKTFDLKKRDNTKLMPAINNYTNTGFDPLRVSFLLNDNNLQKKQIEYLVEEALKYGYDGWDFDLEEIRAQDKDDYSKFIANVKKEFKKRGLIFSVTVHAKKGKKDDWIGSQGQDWVKLAVYADYVRIMAYDFHNRQTKAGSITPIDELREVLEYAKISIPVHKIVLGLPTYGYDWSSRGVKSLQYNEIVEILKKFDGKSRLDTKTQSRIGKYTDKGTSHTIWFEDADTISTKISIARTYGIYQFIFWRLNGEDRRIWNIN